MGIDEGARKLRRAAERKQGAREKPQDEHERHRADAESAAAHHELTQPQHSKGRPVTRAEILARIRALLEDKRDGRAERSRGRRRKYRSTCDSDCAREHGGKLAPTLARRRPASRQRQPWGPFDAPSSMLREQEMRLRPPP